MHSMDFYVSTCRCVMQADANNPESWSELYRLLPCLRQSLTCYVCTKIILDPMGPTHNVCKHTVCKKCIGGKMKLKPSCSWCKDHSTFHENILQKILVSCFKKLCVYIYHSPIGQHLCSISVNGETNSLASILKEGIHFNDNCESSAAHPINLPPLNCVDAEKSPVAGSSKYDNEFNEMKEEAQKQVSATNMFPEEYEAACCANVKRNTVLANSRRQARAASTKKAVVFIKRAAQNRRTKMKFKNLMNQNSKNSGRPRGRPRKVLVKSDSPRPRTVSFNTNSNSSEYLGEPALERVEIDEPVPKRIKQELQLRIRTQVGSSKYDNEFNEMKEEAQKQVSATNMFPEEYEAACRANVKRNTVLANSRRQARAASTKKAVVFIKRAAQNRRKTMKFKNLMNQKSKNSGRPRGRPRKVLVKSDSPRPRTVSFNTNSNSSEYLGEPALERVEIDEPVPKRIKQELQPPELKPPSFCRCGKAGTSNQLTCLGQRCPCYSMKLPCIGCKCKGCRNPKKGPSTEQDKYGSAVVLRSSTIYRPQNEGLCVNM